MERVSYLYQYFFKTKLVKLQRFSVCVSVSGVTKQFACSWTKLVTDVLTSALITFINSFNRDFITSAK